MALVLLLAFIGVPIIEIAVLIQVGGWLGLWPTLGLVILSAVIGSIELRAQGLATVARLREQLDQGEVPAQTLFDGVCLLFAGALLLTPGFVTDAVGLALFLPPVRRFLRVTVGRHVAQRAESHVFVQRGGMGGGMDGGAPGGPKPGQKSDGDVIDADYTEVDTDADTPPPDGGTGRVGDR